MIIFLEDDSKYTGKCTTCQKAMVTIVTVGQYSTTPIALCQECNDRKFPEPKKSRPRHTKKKTLKTSI